MYKYRIVYGKKYRCPYPDISYFIGYGYWIYYKKLNWGIFNWLKAWDYENGGDTEEEAKLELSKLVIRHKKELKNEEQYNKRKEYVFETTLADFEITKTK